MLILTRRYKEKIILTYEDKRIEILYLGNSGVSQARLGIIAPEDVMIMREELEEKWSAPDSPINNKEHVEWL